MHCVRITHCVLVFGALCVGVRCTGFLEADPTQRWRRHRGRGRGLADPCPVHRRLLLGLPLLAHRYDHPRPASLLVGEPVAGAALLVHLERVHRRLVPGPLRDARAHSEVCAAARPRLDLLLLLVLCELLLEPVQWLLLVLLELLLLLLQGPLSYTEQSPE